MLRFLWCLLLAVVWVAVLPAQHRMAPAALQRVPRAELPRQDNEELMARELEARRPDRPHQFAVTIPVDLRPEQDGRWEEIGDRAHWSLRVHSPGAKSLNLGFSEFRLPAGAALYLSTATKRYGPFTAADNDDHGTFWSPLLPGDELLIELELPSVDRIRPGLTIGSVNHDFSGVLDLLVGDCNVDVACGAAEGFPEIDEYRDAIRSVAAYTLNGRSQCTGFLVNNSNQDGRPFFITASHCRVTAENAASLVAYWKYENSSCRPVGTEDNVGAGDGTLDVFNTGARLRARYPPLDFVLLEFDEPVNPRANAYFAGWDIAGPLPAKGVFTVHHPDVEEKRISFSFQTPVLSDMNGEGPKSGAGDFIRIPSWDVGTTERGSSGAPLFNFNGRVIGQLFGGKAACGNQGSDMFGYLLRSWTGGGSPATSLGPWLDPCLGVGVLDGLDQSELGEIVTARENCLTHCRGAVAEFSVSVGADFPPGSRVAVSGDPRLDYDFPATTSGGERFTLAVTPTDDLPAGSYGIDLTVEAAGFLDTLPLTLTLVQDPPPAAQPTFPGNEAEDVDPFLAFSWNTQAGATTYDLQFDYTGDFTAPVFDRTRLRDTTLLPLQPLAGGLRHYWRVRARNACGVGEWSAVRSFTTAGRNCTVRKATGLPVAIAPTDSAIAIATVNLTQPLTVTALEVDLGITHSFVGDLSAELISPAGTVVPLFDPLQNGFCAARNLFVSFRDDAETSAATFAEECQDGGADDERTAQPLVPLSTFYGESARGEWRLVVRDQVMMDGGAITSFRLRICGDEVASKDRGVGMLSEPISRCANDGATARLSLGEGYGQEVSLRVEAGELPLDNYNFTYDALSQELHVIFTSWTLVGAGTYPLAYVVIAEDGGERRAVSTLEVLPLPAEAERPSLNVRDDPLTFRWRISETVDAYRLEVAATPEFDDIVYTAGTRGNAIAVERDALPDSLFYWRVISSNRCGDFTGTPLTAVLDTSTSVRVWNDRTLNLSPNPTRGDIFLRLSGDWTGETFTVNLLSATGQRLRTWRDVRAPGGQFSVGDLPPGVYFLRVAGHTGQLTERLLLLR
jgi:subtilisin-like proprotein convertase family protein